MNNMQPKKLAYFLLFFIAALLCLGLFSCSSSKKFKSTAIVKVDSTTEKKVDQLAVKKIDSMATSIIDSSYQNSITVNFESDVPAENDYEAAPPLKNKPVFNDFSLEDVFIQPAVKKPGNKPKTPYTYNIAGTPVTTDVPIKSIEIKTGGKVEKFNVVQVSGSDSQAVTQNEKTTLNKQEETIVKEKSNWHLPFYVWLLIMGAVVGTGYYLARRYKLI